MTRKGRGEALVARLEAALAGARKDLEFPEYAADGWTVAVDAVNDAFVLENAESGFGLNGYLDQIPSLISALYRAVDECGSRLAKEQVYAEAYRLFDAGASGEVRSDESRT